MEPVKVPAENLPKYRKILPKDNGSSSSVVLNTENPKKGRIYKCCECAEVFNSYRQLKAHNSLHAHNSSVSICKYCCSLYANAETLQKHQSASHEDGKYNCLQCGKYYTSRGHLLNHMLSGAHNAKGLAYYCALCPRSTSFTEYNSLEAIQQHFQHSHLLMSSSAEDDSMEIEMDEEFLDEFVLLSSANDNSLHFSECWDALDLQLPEMLHLDGTTATTSGHEEHGAAFKCPKCNEECANHKMLLKHLQAHHTVNASANNECPYCCKSFGTTASMKRHLRVVHSLVRRHVCQLCDIAFATLDHLKKHVLSQHQNERKHICHVCAKAFTQLCHLKQHLAIHSSGKSIECSICKATFWKKIELQRHMISKHE